MQFEFPCDNCWGILHGARDVMCDLTNTQKENNWQPKITPMIPISNIPVH